MEQREWILIPHRYAENDALDLTRLFKAYKIHFLREVVPGPSGPYGGSHSIRLYLHPESIREGARLLRDYYDLHDPRQQTAYRGPCPACHEPLEEATACSSCGLSFVAADDDPMIEFVREHHGFVSS